MVSPFFSKRIGGNPELQPRGPPGSGLDEAGVSANAWIEAANFRSADRIPGGAAARTGCDVPALAQVGSGSSTNACFRRWPQVRLTIWKYSLSGVMVTKRVTRSESAS